MQIVLKASNAEAMTNSTTSTIAGLIGYLPELHFYQLLYTENIVETRPISELQAIWKDTAQYCSRLANPSSSFSITYLPKTLEQCEREIRQRLSYKQFFADYRFCLVPVRQLITPQWYANLDYVEALKQIAPTPGNLEKALDFVCDEGPELQEPCISNNGASLAFRTPGYIQLCGLPSFPKPLEFLRLDTRRFAINTHMEIRVKPNYLHAGKIGTSLIVFNGIHRSLALMEIGWETIPCLIRDFPKMQRLADSGVFQPNQLGLLPDQAVLGQSRPAYVSDFLDPNAAPRFQQKQLGALWEATPQLQLNSRPMPIE